MGIPLNMKHIPAKWVPESQAEYRELEKTITALQRIRDQEMMWKPCRLEDLQESIDLYIFILSQVEYKDLKGDSDGGKP